MFFAAAGLRYTGGSIRGELFVAELPATAPCPIDDYSDLRPTRQAKNITLTAVAAHFGIWPNDISRLERGLKRDDTLAARYRQWLNTEIIAA